MRSMSEKFWRLLNPGEVVRQGDEILTVLNTWTKVSFCISHIIRERDIFRRPIVFWPHDATIKSGTFESGIWAGCSYEVVDGMFELQNVFVGGKKLKLNVEDI